MIFRLDEVLLQDSRLFHDMQQFVSSKSIREFQELQGPALQTYVHCAFAESKCDGRRAETGGAIARAVTRERDAGESARNSGPSQTPWLLAIPYTAGASGLPSASSNDASSLPETWPLKSGVR